MRTLVSLIIAVVSAVGIWYATRLMLPRAQSYDYKVCKMVPEQRVRDEIVKVTVDGKVREIRVPVEYTVTKPVWETRTIATVPILADWLKFGIVVLCFVFLYIYMLCVLFLWARNMAGEVRESERVRDVRSRLNGILGLVLGIILGFMGGKYLTTPNTPIGSPSKMSEYADPVPLPETFDTVDPATYESPLPNST